MPLVQADLTTPYVTQYSYTASAIDSSTHYPNFDPTQGNCAGVGVIYSADGLITDTDPNQLNGAGSAFYDADMRDIEQPFDDAYVEFVGLRSGMGAVPYLYFTNPPAPAVLDAFQRLWFANANYLNYLHLIGAANYYGTQTQYAGDTPYVDNLQDGCSFIWVQEIATVKPTSTEPWVQYTTVHELTHNFSIQGFSVNTYHCTNLAYSPPDDGLNCIMDSPYNLGAGPPRFCVPHLFTGGSTLIDVQTSIRQQSDPLPY